MDIKSRDKRLAAIFSKDILSQLDDAEKNVLGEEFSNSELKILATQEIEVIHNRLKNHLESEFQRRLTQIQPEEYEVLKDWYIENSHTLDEIICGKCGVLLGIEIDTIDDTMNPYHHEGKFVVPIGDKLMSYRPRMDGLMGYQCGNIITDESLLEEWKEYDRLMVEREEKYQAEEKEALENLAKWGDLDHKEQKRISQEEPELLPHSAIYSPEPPRPEKSAFTVCDNDTRWGQIEIDNIDESHVMTSITKEDRIKVKQQMDATNYIPDVTETDSGKTVETFELRKVK